MQKIAVERGLKGLDNCIHYCFECLNFFNFVSKTKTTVQLETNYCNNCSALLTYNGYTDEDCCPICLRGRKQIKRELDQNIKGGKCDNCKYENLSYIVNIKDNRGKLVKPCEECKSANKYYGHYS